VYWKNGVEIPLFTQTDGFNDARAIAVTRTDLYMTGIEVFNSTGQNVFLWKTGFKMILTSPVNRGTKREGTGIAVAGADVYVSGNTGSAAVYWKNGVASVGRSIGRGYGYCRFRDRCLRLRQGRS
jgi:hypothetical protein